MICKIGSDIDLKIKKVQENKKKKVTSKYRYILILEILS